MVGRNWEQVKKMSSRMSRKQSMRRRGAEDGPEVGYKLASRADRTRASEGVEQEAVNWDEIG